MSLYTKLDFHIHTYHSACAKRDLTPDKIIRRAQEKGYQTIGFSDHLHEWSDPKIISQLRDECESIDSGDLTIFIGAEADVISTTKISIDEELAKTLDFVSLAASHIHLKDYIQQPASLEPSAVADHYLAMFMTAVQTKFVDLIPHPFYTGGSHYGDMNIVMPLIKNDALINALEIAKDNGIAMEMSKKIFAPEYGKALWPFYRLCKEVGVKFAMGSDSHTLNEIGDTHCLAPLVKELKLTDDDYWYPKKKSME